MKGIIMADDSAVRQTVSENHGWRVTFAGMGINLALGILYTWSIISKGVPDEWGWTQSDKSLPYAMACLVFSLVMVPAGRMQDKISPRVVASIGGILVGLGMIIASFTTSPLGYMLGFGVLAGAGIGFGYASATPPAVKWFSPAKTGLIAGIVVSGFGLASAYAAPMLEGLIATVGLAVGNGSGRVIAGVVSDKLGRKITLFLFFLFQAALLILAAIMVFFVRPPHHMVEAVAE